MTLSIITINKNNAIGLEKTCISVTTQIFTDFEWIVIDGASDDNSIEIINDYSNKINYWISESDTGIYNAMNKGIKKANGEYLLFLNSGDCLVTPQTLENLLLEIKNNPVADIYYSDRINANGTIFIYPKFLDVNYLVKRTLSHQNTLIKKQLFYDHGFYNENLKIASDWEFFLKEIWIYKSIFSYINTKISIFDLNGIGSQNSIDCYNENIKVFQNVFNELSNSIIELYNSKKNNINNYGILKLLIVLFDRIKKKLI